METNLILTVALAAAIIVVVLVLVAVIIYRLEKENDNLNDELDEVTGCARRYRHRMDDKNSPIYNNKV